MQIVSLGFVTGLLISWVSLVSAVDDWVLHVPAGKHSAEEVAKLHDLDNLGEVIPETNLFHFKQTSKRKKRSLEDLKEAFEANPAINAHIVQDKSLSRVKRVPLPEHPEEDQSVENRRKRQTAPVRSTGNQICFINTVTSETKESRRCIFPFSYKGKTYVQCTADHSGNGAEWCATQVDAEGEVINKQWGDCDKKSLSCLTLGAGSLGQANPTKAAKPAPGPEVSDCITVGGGSPNQKCVFPFKFNNVVYNGCTLDPEDNKYWCSTLVDENGLHVNDQGKWGHCGNGCPIQQAAPKRPAPKPQRPAPPPRRPAPAQAPRRPPQNLPFGLPPGFDQGSSRLPPQRFPPQGLPKGFNPQQGFPPGFNPQTQFDPRQFQQGLPKGFNPQQGLPINGLPSSSTNSKQAIDPAIAASLLKGIFGDNVPVLKPKSELEWPEVDRTQYKTYLNDEAWPAMWYLNRGGRGMDMNVEDAWAQGITGKGVVVSILDDGVEWNHPDLKANYDKEASTDLNDNDDDPFPRYDFLNSNKHGTRCAGTVAAVANNSNCAVGVAFNAKVGGVRILDGSILDALEAKAISFNRNHIDIYSASWGPDDDGRTVDGPGPLAKLALEQGIIKGRQGKGSIFVWASGNGGKHFDNCNCDGYTTSIYTLSVSSVSENGNIPWYSEACSSSLVTTFSSGSTNKALKERKVVTTDLHGKCTPKHTGTSASSPMAAGITALTLEANPDLTWRDMQHIVVRTAIPRGLLKADDWANNSIGLEFSHSFGFGLMDAGAMVRLAKVWKTVPEAVKCTTQPGQSGVNKNRPMIIKPGTEETIPLDATNCGDVKFLEHLHLNIDATSGANRGDLSVLLRSPGGTVSILLGPRPKDLIPTGFGAFTAWPMMSVHFWGEPVLSPTYGGVWSLTLNNAGNRPCILNDWGMTFYGTRSDPQPGVSIRPVFMPFPVGPIGPVLFTPNDSDDTNTPDNTDIPQYDDDEILEDDVELIDPENPEPPLEDPGRFDPDEDTTDTTRIVEETTPVEDFSPTEKIEKLEKSETLDELQQRLEVEAFQALLG